jgi:PAS domain S-box-containing protein
MRPPEQRAWAVALLPALIGLIVTGTTLGLWRELRLHDSAQVRRTLASEADGAKREIRARVEPRLLNLVRMAERWSARHSTPRTEWQQDAAALIKHYPEMQAVAWVDSSFRVAWVVPATGDWASADLGQDAAWRTALEDARASGTARFVGAFGPGDGPGLIMAVAPILVTGRFDGFIVGVFRSQDMLQLILANVADGLSISVSDAGRIIYLRGGANHALEADWSVESEVSIAGTRWRLRVWPSQQWLASAESMVDELVLAGGLLLAFLLALTVHLAQTAGLRWRDLTREVAQRKQSQDRAAFLAAIVDSSGDAVIGVTTDGTVVSWNSGAERLYGYSATEMIGRSSSVLIPPDRAAELQKLLDTIRRGELVGDYETVRVRKDGAQVQMSLTVSPITDADGAIVGGSSIARDITRRKRAEAEIGRALVQLEQMERSTRDESIALASTSHDVRGALTVIAGFAEVLSEEPTADGAREMALRIASLAYTVANVLTDVLQHTSGDTPGEAVPKTVSAMALVKTCTEDWRAQCEQKGLALRVDPPAEGLVVLDPVYVTRIMHNLISNAIRYTSRGEIRVRGELTPNTLRIAVEDTGIGIPPEEIDRIFEQFYRTDEARKLHGLGTGLGLATVKRLVELSGGQVHVRSIVGQGTTFEFILPRRPPV